MNLLSLTSIILSIGSVVVAIRATAIAEKAKEDMAEHILDNEGAVAELSEASKSIKDSIASISAYIHNDGGRSKAEMGKVNNELALLRSASKQMRVDINSLATAHDEGMQSIEDGLTKLTDELMKIKHEKGGDR